MAIYVFGCQQGHRTERLVPLGTERAACETCGESCGRVYQYSMAITQPEVDTRGMFRRFDEASQELAHKGIDTSGAWHASKALAAAHLKAGEHPARRQW